MKNIFVALLFLSAFYGVNAQELNILKSLDRPDSILKSKVVVNNNVWINLNAKSDYNVSAYRIRLFFDNEQDSRNIAYGVKSRFETEFPTIPVKVEYKVPNFMVTAGYFLTHVEATAFLSKVNVSFPSAFIIPVEVPISTFKRDIIPVTTIDMAIDSTTILIEEDDEIQ
ncbi:MAG: hypothetical protein RRZ64_05570 [Rikenellaceae bacterium]